MSILPTQETKVQIESMRGPKGETGEKGETGSSGVYSGPDAPQDPSVSVWIDTDDGADTVDYSAYGVPTLMLTGDTSAMSKENAVELTYYYGDLSGRCTCKWQGSSSLYHPKKNYTIKFDQEFEAKTGWGAHDKYVMKADWVDASHLRNLLGANLWGKMVKGRDSAPQRLKDLPNGGAVDGFPVWITLNGESMGLYTFTIPKDGWLLGMTEADTAAGFVCLEDYRFDQPALGDESDIEIEYAVGDKATLLASFNNMVERLNAVQSAEDIPALEEVLDIASVVDYIFFTVLTMHHDGLIKNMLMSTYDGVKWFASAYDMDAIFGNNWDGASYFYPLDHPFVSTMPTFRGGANHKLFEVVTTYCKDALGARVWDVAFSNAPFTINMPRLMETVYKLAVGIPGTLLAEDNRLWPGRPGTATNNIEQILAFYRCRWEEFTKDGSALNLYTQIWPT